MALLPLDIIQEILSFNNSQAVLDRPTLQYVFRILSYDPFQEVRDLYARIHLRGTVKFTRLRTNYSDSFDTRWYEINHSGKWTVRYISERYPPLFDAEVCVSHQFQFCGHKMSFSLP